MSAGPEPGRCGWAEVAELLGNAGIIRSRAKIEATIGGAKVHLAMHEQGEEFSDICWSFTDGEVLKGDGRSFPVKTELSERIAAGCLRRDQV